MARFHVRARTVDMLGRQQIAGIPTAISELFKNAHDAYARTVEADYFRDDDLLVLRDDGLGMTREDFERRWLTLGTDSKLGMVPGLPPPPTDPSQETRPVLGEKGIGRLAVAILGPQLFVLSRARRDGSAADTMVGAYLNWNLFAQPGLDLDDIEIPVREFPANKLPTSSAIKSMIEEFEVSIKALSDRIPKAKLEELYRNMETFDIDPEMLLGELGEPSFAGTGTGTHFFIQPVDKILQDDLDDRQDAGKATKFEKHLLGFTNTMTPEFNRPPIIARFRDYPDEGAPNELIGDAAFFTPEEFKAVDHHIFGRFDEYGQFRGNVGIYQTKPDYYVLNWHETDGRKTLCGPFDFSVAVIQGAVRDSLLPPDEFARMARKTNRHGGVYVYKDGIRVQPYGDTDYDWLDIERRRTLGAAYYFYSFRRMFGAIELTREANGALQEKAGREGFIENRAYRQFRSILVNFFLQSAADFFREEGRHAEGWEESRAELQKNHDIRRRKARQARARKETLGLSLSKFFTDLDGDVFTQKADRALREVRRQSDRILKSRREPATKALALMRIEKQGRDALRDIRKGMAVTKPRGVGLSRTLSSQWAVYTEEARRVEGEILGPVEESIEEYVSLSAKSAGVPLKHFARIDAAVRRRTGEAVGTARRLRRASDESVEKVSDIAHSTAKESFRAVDFAVNEVIQELESVEHSRIDVESLLAKRRELERRVELVLEREGTRLQQLKEQFDLLATSWSKDGIDTLDLTEALEEELEELREQRENDLEMAQIGMAVNIVSHEFEKTVGALRNGFRRMGAWARANPELEELYKNMRGAFDHLDGYLAMFTPLDRRLHPVKVKIGGKDIFAFLRDLFAQRLERHRVTFSVTESFGTFEVEGYPSTFYPVFANLLDNSIFWLQRMRERPREIVLDADGDDLLVRDNGPGVSARDRENIFLPRFSRKPGGRGMGLHVSRATLDRAGYDLLLDPSRGAASGGAVFRIAPKGSK